MSDKKNGTRKNPRVFVIIIILLILAAVLIWAGIRRTQNGENDTDTTEKEEAVSQDSVEEETSEEASESVTVVEEQPAEMETEDTGLTFPYTIEEDKLTVDSFFQFTGPNPDCNDEEGEDISSIQLTNHSGKYLEKADITLNLADGTEYLFHIEEIPDGKTVLAFDASNQSYQNTSGVADIDVQTLFADNVSLKEESVSISNEEGTVTLKNISGEDLKNLTVKYHCEMDGTYYGGHCNEQLVENLPAGESIELDTSECYFGDAAVVSITG